MDKKENPFNVKVGEIWIENDPRVTHKIEIIGFSQNRYGFPCARIQNIRTGKITNAKLNRFNGKSGGYSRA